MPRGYGRRGRGLRGANPRQASFGQKPSMAKPMGKPDVSQYTSGRINPLMSKVNLQTASVLRPFSTAPQPPMQGGGF